jgi:hypothetical protein
MNHKQEQITDAVEWAFNVTEHVKTYSKVKHPNAAQISHHKLKTMNNTII